MSYDGIVTRCITHELQKYLLGGRINRIHQPNATLIRLDIHNEGKTRKVLLSTGGNAPRLYIAEEVPENPQNPPQFCMVLRKHLQNGKVIGITQEGTDRVIHFDVQSYNELGVSVSLRLTVEMMGKYSNVFLVNESGVIIEAQKRISKEISSVRMVYPGIPYEIIPSEKREIVQSIALPKATDADLKLQKWLLQTYEGFGPLICRELAFQAELEPNTSIGSLSQRELERLHQALLAFQTELIENRYKPSIMYEGDTPKAFYAFPLLHMGASVRSFATVSECIEAYFRTAQSAAPTLQQEEAIRQAVRHRLEKTQTKLVKIEAEYEESLDRKEDLVFADLLSANATKVKPGDTEITVENFFDEALAPVTIPLDPKKNPWQNAQHYYKSYTKRKNRERILGEQIPAAKQELGYLLQVLQNLDTIETPAELREIRAELTEQGVLKHKSGKQKPDKRQSSPLAFESTDGFLIYVGKNNKQNDQLTLKTANKEDYFFHAKDVPGSHVILRSGTQEPPERTILEAAWLAAAYSSEKAEEFVLVDYTKKKNVRKAKSALPGAVFYDRYKTLQVDLKNPPTKAQARTEQKEK